MATTAPEQEPKLLALIRSKELEFKAALGPQRPWLQWWAIAQHYALVNVDRIKWAEVAGRDIITAFMNAAKLGLLIDGEECLVMVRGKGEKAKVKCEVCSQGVVRKAGQAGIRIQARVVKEGDAIEIDEGTGVVHHTPAWLKGLNPGKTIGAYAIGEYRDGKRVVRSMSRDDVLRRAPKESAAWDNWEDEMAQKTVVLSLRKVLYFGDDIESLLSEPAVAVGDTWGMGVEQEEDVPVHPPQSVKDKVRVAAARREQDEAAEDPQRSYSEV